MQGLFYSTRYEWDEMTFLYVLGGLLVVAGLVYFSMQIKSDLTTRKYLNLLGCEAPVLEQGGIRFRDLNKNGKLDIYEDPRHPIEERVEDLLSQMTLEEKVGLMFQPPIGGNDDGTLLKKQLS